MQNLLLTPLKPISKLRTRERIGFCDIETMSTTSDKFRCGSICYEYKKKKNVLTFFNEIEYFSFIFSHFDIVYFYNIAFDINYVQNYVLHNTNYQSNEISSQSQLLGVKFYDNESDFSITFKDLFPFCQTSLDKASIEYNTETKKYPIIPNDLDDFSQQIFMENFFNNCSDSEIQQHCENDVKILFELFKIIQKEGFDTYGVDCFNKKIYSSPSFFMKAYRTKFLSKPIENPFFLMKFEKGKKPKTIVKEKLYNFVKESYRGGYCNCETTELLENQLSYDISSAYPFGITAIRFGVGQPIFTSDYNFWYKMALKIPSIAKVEIIQTIPLVCIIENGKLVKKIGTITANLTSFEIFTILRYGGKILHFYEGLVFFDYDKTNSLAKYERFMYKRKCNSKGGQKTFAKLGCNSIYGKFGQHYKMEKTVLQYIRNNEDFETITLTDKSIERFIQFDKGGIVFRKEQIETKKPYMIVLWSSLITAFVRIYLLEEAFRSKSNYEDTDSIKINEENEILLKNVLTPNLLSKTTQKFQHLGYFEKEEKFLMFRSLAPKIYCGITENEEKIVKAKGIPKSVRMQLFDDILEGKAEIITDSYWKWLKPKESLRRKNVDIKSDIFGGIVETNKTINPTRKNDCSLLEF